MLLSAFKFSETRGKARSIGDLKGRKLCYRGHNDMQRTKGEAAVIIQLVHLLSQIETQVNSHQGDIRQTLADHGRTLHKSFQTAISYVAAIHHPVKTGKTFTSYQCLPNHV